MDLQLDGKRALVTGSSSGIGAATARVLAAEGAAVVVHGRDRDRTNRVTEEINAAGGSAIAVVGDLSTDYGATQVCDAIESHLRGIDILVNNAGGGGGRSPARGETPGFLELLPEDWVGAYEHNVVAAVRMIRRFAPGMVERGWGRIIQTGSVTATAPVGTMNDYAAAKAAIVNLSVGLSRALAHTGVTANTVSPGLVLTPQTLDENSHKKPWVKAYARSRGWDETLRAEELEQRWAREWNVPAGRGGRVENITSIIAVLASPLGAFVTGANIRVDGGQNPTVN
jgi:NAD(P)-dependent dehydrogenase (short-subunit alcohol dehydrogenase family)